MTRQIYFDFSRDGTKTSSNDVAIQENEWAVVESVSNILINEPNTLLYKKRNIGARLQRFLFEPIDNLTAFDILEEVDIAISLYEPRAKNVEVIVTPREDLNTFEIQVTCTIDESDRSLVIEETLEKLR